MRNGWAALQVQAVLVGNLKVGMLAKQLCLVVTNVMIMIT